MSGHEGEEMRLNALDSQPERRLRAKDGGQVQPARMQGAGVRERSLGRNLEDQRTKDHLAVPREPHTELFQWEASHFSRAETKDNLSEGSTCLWIAGPL